MRHGDLLTMTMSVHDPAFLTEPLVWSVTFARNDAPQPVSEEPFCHASPEIPIEDAREVPFFLPGTNPAIKEVMNYYGVPESSRTRRRRRGDDVSGVPQADDADGGAASSGARDAAPTERRDRCDPH